MSTGTRRRRIVIGVVVLVAALVLFNVVVGGVYLGRGEGDADLETPYTTTL